MTDQLPNDEKHKDSANSKDNELSDVEMLKEVNNLPEKTKKSVIAKLEMYSGPIPHPEILKGYQQLYKDAPKKIIDNGIAESEHRRKLETERQRNRQRMAKIALYSAVFICILLILVSGWLIYTGHSIVGGILGGGSFITVVSSLFNQSEQLTKSDDLNSKNEKESK